MQKAFYRALVSVAFYSAVLWLTTNQALCARPVNVQAKPQLPPVDFGPYMANMRRSIRAHWRPPHEGDQRRIIVTFDVDMQGRVSNLKLDQSSDSAACNQMALKAISDASPFGVLPEGAPNNVTIQFTFDVSWPEITRLTEQIARNPHDAHAYYSRAMAYASCHQNQKAIDDFSKAIELNLKDCDAYAGRAQAYREQGKLKEAIPDFSQAIACKPKWDPCYGNRAQTYRELGQYDLAIADFSAAIARKPRCARYYADRAITYHKSNRLGQALVDYTKAIALDPNDKVAFFNRALCYSNLGQSGRAVADFSKAIKFAPHDASCYQGRAEEYIKLGRYEDAMVDRSAAIAIDGTNASAYVARGRVYELQGQLWRAVSDYTQALDIEPGNAEALAQRASAYSELRLDRKALDDLAVAVRIDSDNATLYHNRGDIYARLGKYELAIADYSKAFDLDPESAGYSGFSGTQSALFTAPYRFVDRSGKVRFKHPVYSPGNFSEGLASVRVGDLYGYINKNGNFCLRPQFLEAGEFHEGLAAVRRSVEEARDTASLVCQADWGFIDKNGKMAFAANDYRIDSDSWFSDGLAVVSVGDRCGYVDKSGRLAIKPLFEWAGPFCDGLAAVKIGLRYGFINKAGKLVIEPQFNLAGNFSDGLAPVIVLNQNSFPRRLGTKFGESWSAGWDPAVKIVMESQYGFIDKTGALVIKPQFTLSKEMAEQLLNTRRSFSADGKPIHEIHLFRADTFSSELGFAEGLAAVLVGKKYGFVDKTGKVYISPRFDKVGHFSEGLVTVLVGKNYGFADTNGAVVIKPHFESAAEFSEGFAAVIDSDLLAKAHKCVHHGRYGRR